MPRFVVDYSRDVPRPQDLDDTDKRLFSSAAARNVGPLLEVIVPKLRAAKSAGAPPRLVEIGSGTGQHAVALARQLPDWTIEPSDPNANHIASIDAWRAHANAPNLAAPVSRDILSDRPAVAPGVSGTSVASGTIGTSAEAGACGAILAINVLHIAPFEVTRALLALAQTSLAAEGVLLIYGPFIQGTLPLQPSNADFDRDLRTENPDWGLRNTTDIAREAHHRGLQLADQVAMPANNLVLVLSRTEQA